MGPWLVLVVPLVLATAGEGLDRFRRQSHHPGAPLQFALAPRRQVAPAIAIRPEAFQFQGPTTAAPLLQQQQHLSSPFLPTPRPALPPSSPQAGGNRRPPSGGNTRGRLSVTREQLADELPEEEEEPEKPDRLTELLPLSKFDCSGRGTGYYADEGLQCEVFHYCQGGARHSWICPEGFTFHQVHLICMPPGGDNICQKSSQFHFVNEYLYRPLNAEEAQTKPNVTLRYADRYYPENYDRDDDEQQPLVFSAPQRHPAPHAKRPQPVLRPQQIVRLVPQQQPQQQAYRSNQVFHSPEEVNIPLQHRRPVVQQRSRDNYDDQDDYDDQPTYRQG